MTAPKASVIVPCRNAADTVEEAVSGALASSLRDIEVLAVDDGSSDGTAEVIERLSRRDPRVRLLKNGGSGVSSARNAGLDAARGEFIFFLDADDTVDPEFFPLAVAAMDGEGADYCRAAHVQTFEGRRSVVPLKTDFRVDGQEAIRRALLPCFFGYSFDQVRAWYRGEPLNSRRVMGGVWGGCFRAGLIRRNGIRFDEAVSLFEDAMFLSEYLLACRRTTMLDPERPFYEYRLSASGSMISKMHGVEFFGNKLRLLAKRKELDAKAGGQLAGQYAASCVFSLLEILRASFLVKGCLRKGLGTFFAYGGDPVVRAALRGFPVTWRKPALAAAVLLCRLVARRRNRLA